MRVAMDIRSVLVLAMICSHVLAMMDAHLGNGRPTKELDSYAETLDGRLYSGGSVNQQPDNSAAISSIDERMDDKMRLKGVENVLSNYLPEVTSMEAIGLTFGHASSQPHETNALNILHEKQKHTKPGRFTHEAISNPVMGAITTGIEDNEGEDAFVNSDDIIKVNRKKRHIIPEVKQPTFRVNQRGIMRNVAQRIAYGFGKRNGDSIYYGNDNPLNEVKDTFSETEEPDRKDDIYIDDGMSRLLQLLQGNSYYDGGSNKHMYADKSYRGSEGEALTAIVKHLLDDITEKQYRSAVMERPFDEQSFQ